MFRLNIIGEPPVPPFSIRIPMVQPLTTFSEMVLEVRFDTDMHSVPPATVFFVNVKPVAPKAGPLADMPVVKGPCTVISLLIRAHNSEEILRADSLLDDVRHGEDRAERLYNAAEAILRRALAAKDLRTAIQAIRAAADVMAEGRQYLELRGDLTGEFESNKPQTATQKIQVIALPQLIQTRPPDAPCG
jgi:hypothetical protein